MPLVCGVDSGTQSCKVEIRDVDTGALVARGNAAHPPTTPPRSEQDPTSWYDAFRAAFEQAGAPDVAAISVAGQQHGMVVLDRSGSVIRPAKLWNDTESAPEAEELVARLGAEAWAVACGSVPVASFTITKLLWLKRNEPENFSRISRVLLPHDWLTYRLTGAFVTDRGDASGTAYWSSKNGWRPDLLALVDDSRDWMAALPEVVGPSDGAGSWNGRVVAAGTGDNMAAALGIGLRPGDVAVSIGTSGTVYAVSEQPTADPSGAVAGFADATGRFLPLVCTLNATKVTEAVADWLGCDRETFERLGESAREGSGGVVCVPYLDGERTPNLPRASGSFTGLRTTTTREEVARAAFEGVVCGLLDALDALTEAGVDTSGTLHLVGGGARSRVYRQVLADLSGRAVVTSEIEEHVALGACVQAACALDGAPPFDIRSTWTVGDEIPNEPRDMNRWALRDAFRRARDRFAPG